MNPTVEVKTHKDVILQPVEKEVKTFVLTLDEASAKDLVEHLGGQNDFTHKSTHLSRLFWALEGAGVKHDPNSEVYKAARRALSAEYHRAYSR